MHSKTTYPDSKTTPSSVQSLNHLYDRSSMMNSSYQYYFVCLKRAVETNAECRAYSTNHYFNPSLVCTFMFLANDMY